MFDPQCAEFVFCDGPRLFRYALGGGKKRGYGDCDDITAASGALLRSIGMDVQICTTAPPMSPYIFTHVFLRTKPPRGREWIIFDPVVYPKKGLGFLTPHRRIAIWDLQGRLLDKSGDFPKNFDQVMAFYGSEPDENAKTIITARNEESMSSRLPTFYDFPDQSGNVRGLFGAADIVDERNAAQMNALRDDRVLADFQTHGILGFGCYSGVMGMTPGDQMPYIMAEYDDTDTIGDTGYVRTKHFEMSPDDYATMVREGAPRMGTLALADDGEVYQYVSSGDGLGGFFKKLFKKIKKGFKKITGGIRKGLKFIGKKIKKFVRKTAFGRFLWKVGSKIFKTAMKIVKPLLKVVGPIAKKIAPIAAFIPGIGPAVAGGLLLTGKVYDISKKVGMVVDKFGKPHPKDKKQAQDFARELAKAGRDMGKEKAATVIAEYRKKKGMSGYAGLGATFADPNVNSYYLTPPQQAVGWF